MVDPILSAIAVAVIKAIGTHVDDQGGGLAYSLGTHVGSASGTSAVKKVEAYFKHGKRSEALGAAIERAIDSAQRLHDDFIAQLGPLPSGFGKHEAAPEIAKLLVLGIDPDPGALVTEWMNAFGHAPSVSEVVEAIAVCSTLLDRLKEAIETNPLFVESTEEAMARADSLKRDRIVKILGAGQADGAARVRYLDRVQRDHSAVRTTGIEAVADGGDLLLSDIYTPLRLQRVNIWSDSEQGRLDRQLEELDERLRREQVDVASIEDKVDELIQRELESRTSYSTHALPEPTDDVLNRHQHVVVLGDPGSGKSTLAAWAALTAANKAILDIDPDHQNGEGRQPRFPIWVKAGDIVDEDGWSKVSMVDFFVSNHVAKRSYPDADSLNDLFTSELAAGNCLVIFDACDEIPDPSDRQAVISRIDFFVR